MNERQEPGQGRSRANEDDKPRDEVDEASDESFPASDPPSFTRSAATGDEVDEPDIRPKR